MIDNIDYRKTIKSNKLILKSNWMELIDFVLYMVAMALIAFIFIKALWIGGLKNDVRLWFYISPISILFVIYLTYKKINEKKLLTLQTHLTKSENRKIVLSYVQENGFILVYNNENYIIAEKLVSISPGKQISFLFSNGEIKFNCITTNIPTRMPVLFFSNKIRKVLNERVREYSITKNGIISGTG